MNAQHRMIRKAFGGKLLLAPISLEDGDRVLESGVGSGIYKLLYNRLTVSIQYIR